MSDQSLIVGIGSPHGDDAVGWIVANQIAEQVSARRLERICVRRTHAPSDLLDWLEGIATLDVCDAMDCRMMPGQIACWSWPDDALADTRFRCSHDVSLSAVLALGEQLRRLPPTVRVWGITIAQAGELQPMSPSVVAAVPAIVREILGVIHRA